MTLVTGKEHDIVRTKRIAWWLAPAVVVMVFDAWLAIHELTGGGLLGDVDPRTEIRFAAAAIWLAFAVATSVGLAFQYAPSESRGRADHHRFAPGGDAGLVTARHDRRSRLLRRRDLRSRPDRCTDGSSRVLVARAS
jgi:hypothetical protein